MSYVTPNLSLPEDLKKIVLDFRQMSAFMQDPLIIDRAEGIYYWDIHGNLLIDGLSGIFVANYGHGNRTIIDAVKEQLERLAFTPPMHGTSPQAVALANKIAAVTPEGLNTVKLLSGGSEATEAAMKLARQYFKQSGKPTKYKVICRNFAYHGATMGVLSYNGVERRRSPFEPLLSGAVRVHPPTCYRCPFEKTYPECAVFCARTVEDTIRMEGPDTVAAVLMEPIGNTGGIITPPEEYFPILREICDRNEVLLIFDEIITGFGRTGNMFAADTFKTTPDILCMGKGMSGGYAPLSGIAFSDRIAEAFWGPEEAGVEFAHGHTYAANPVAAAAGLAALQELETRNLIHNCREVGAYLYQKLLELQEELEVIGEVRGKGLLYGMELVKDRASKSQFSPPIGVRLGKEALKRGLLTRFDPHWIALAPPLIVTTSDIDEIVGLLHESLKAVLQHLD
ncbi:MAG: aspartate aminotransferase family protein [Armatimonadetes bacterium]|nr:aspartate aminotransferase family protein [Armatimonadota bacterium]